MAGLPTLTIIGPEGQQHHHPYHVLPWGIRLWYSDSPDGDVWILYRKDEVGRWAAVDSNHQDHVSSDPRDRARFQREARFPPEPLRQGLDKIVEANPGAFFDPPATDQPKGR